MSDCLHPTQVSWLPVPKIWHRLLYTIKLQLTSCFKSSKPTQIDPCMLIPLSIHLHSLHPDALYGQTWHLSTQLRSGVRTVVPLYCNRPYYPTTRFWSPSSHVISARPFPDNPRHVPCKSAQMGSCPITFLWLWPGTDHEPQSWHMPTLATNEIWCGLKLLHTYPIVICILLGKARMAVMSISSTLFESYFYDICTEQNEWIAWALLLWWS